MVGPVIQDEVIQIRRNPWVDNFFRPLLITIMIMCLSLSMVNLVQLINPAWRGAYLLLGMLITSVEAIYSYRVLRSYRSRGVSVLRYRLAEMVLLVLVLKGLSLMNTPWPAIGSRLQTILASPSLFLDIEFYMILTLAFMVWGAATLTIADFEALYDPYRDNRATLDSLAERYFWGGGLLVVISGVTRWVGGYGAASLVDWQRPALSGIIFNVLIYFTLGLVLLSQVNLTTHLVRWRIQKISVASGLGRQWAKYGFIFLGVITLAAFVLPTGYSLGLLDTAGMVLKILIGILIFLFQLFVLLISLPIVWLMSLLGASPGDSGGVASPEFGPLFGAESGGSGPPWLEILRSLVFWLVTLAIVGYMLKIYLDDHPDLLKQMSRLRLIGRLISLIGQMWRYLRGWAQTGLDMIPRRMSKRGSGQAGPTRDRLWDWLGLRQLSPRERIIYYYLNILNRAKKEAPTRKAHETPYEYEPNLAAILPDVQPEIHELTDVFVYARYSQAKFTPNQVSLVKVMWQRVRQALRSRRRENGNS